MHYGRGTLKGYLMAVDARSGRELYRFETPSGIIGNGLTDSHKGRQFVAVLSGVGGWAGIGLTDPADGAGAVGAYAALSSETALCGQLTIFALPERRGETRPRLTSLAQVLPSSYRAGRAAGMRTDMPEAGSIATVPRALTPEASTSPQLARTLSAFDLICLGVGATIGAGIFVLTGTAAANYAGPGLTLSFLLGGVACAFVGLCYAELAAMIPAPGSTYTYASLTLGELCGWIIGWDLVLEYAMAAATVAVGWSGYVQSLMRDVGLALPVALTAAPGTPVDGGHALLNLPAALVVLALTVLLVRGNRESARANAVMVALKLAIILAFIGVGALHVSTALWSPFIPPNTGTFGEFGWSGILRGAGVVFFAFIGFETISTAAAETRNPQRDAPIGLLGSLLICTILYVAVAAVLTGLIPYRALDVADPMAKAVDAIGLGAFAVVIKIGAILGLTTSGLAALYGQARVFYAMARDGLLPAAFSRVHPRFQTPAASQAAIGVITALVAALTPIDALGELVSIGTLFAFIVVCMAVLILRRTQADTHRPFRAPGGPLTPILGILACLGLMVGLPGETWLRLAGWLGIGLAIYFAYGRRRARRLFERPA